MNAGGVLGRIAPAYLSDRLGRFNLLVPSAFLSGLSCLVFWFFAKSLVSVMLFSVVYGFLSGSFVSVINPCVAQISEMSQMGTRTGMLYSIISFPWVPLLFFFSFFFFLSLSFLPPILYSMVAVMFCRNKFVKIYYKLFINKPSLTFIFLFPQISPWRTGSRRSISSWSWILQFHDFFLRFNHDIWFFLHFSC